VELPKRRLDESQCGGEAAYRIGPWPRGPAAFQIRDRPHAELRAFREFLLGERRCVPVSAQHIPE